MEETGDRIELRSGSLRVLIELAPLRLSLGNEAEGLHLRGARPRLRLGDQSLFADRASVVEPKASGKLKLRADLNADLELELEIAFASNSPALELGLRVTNRGNSGIEIDALDSLFCDPADGGELELPGRELRMLQMGFHSGTPARSTRLSDQSRAARGGETTGPRTPPGTREFLTSDVATQVAAPSGPVLAFGFVSHRQWFTHVSLRHHGRIARGFHARTELENATVLEPGASLHAERFWITLLPGGSDGIAQWASRAAETMHARGIRSEEVLGLEVAGPIESLGPLLDLGVRVATLRANAQLPLSKHTLTGLKTWASAAKARGIRPALCFAPFLLPERSELANRHPDWFLSDDGGGPIRLQHRGEAQLVLDPGKPKVQSWLRDLATSLRRAGIHTLELEKLDVCTLPGLRGPEQAPALEAYRRAIGTLRDSLGEEAYLIGTDAPIGPSIGIFDAVRMGPQPGAHWQPSWLKRLRGDSDSGAEAALVAVLSRANLHRRLWCNEAGPFGFAFATGRMKAAEQEACRTISGFCARSVLAVDSLEQSRTEPSFYWPTATQPLRMLPATAEQPDFIYQHWPDGSVVVLAINLSSRSRELKLDAETFGLVGPMRPFSVSARKLLSDSANPISSGPIAPHGVVLLRLVATRAESQVLGSSLHYSAGSLGTEIERATDGTLVLHARLPGRRSGRIWYTDTTGDVRDVELGFEDEISVQLPAAESGPWERQRR